MMRWWSWTNTQSRCNWLLGAAWPLMASWWRCIVVGNQEGWATTLFRLAYICMCFFFIIFHFQFTLVFIFVFVFCIFVGNQDRWTATFVKILNIFTNLFLFIYLNQHFFLLWLRINWVWPLDFWRGDSCMKILGRSFPKLSKSSCHDY